MQWRAATHTSLQRNISSFCFPLEGWALMRRSCLGVLNISPLLMKKKHTLFLKGMFKRLIRFTRRWCPRRRPGLSTWSHSLLLRTSPQCCCQGATWKKNQRGRVFFSSRQILFWGRFFFLEEAFFLKTLYALQDMNCNVFVAILFGMTLSNNSCFLETGSFKTSADVD